MPGFIIPAKRRYLVRFDPKRIPHAFADVLIIGGGIAGIRAALAVEPSQGVIVVTKDRLLQSNSAYAQGGIAAVTSKVLIAMIWCPLSEAPVAPSAPPTSVTQCSAGRPPL